MFLESFRFEDISGYKIPEYMSIYFNDALNNAYYIYIYTVVHTSMRIMPTNVNTL